MGLRHRRLLIVLRFVFGRRDVANRLEQPAMIEPVHPLERREFHRLKMPPRALASNDFGFEEADCVRHAIVITCSTPS